jgi:C4-dicarboxylate transporter, DctQ subunit
MKAVKAFLDGLTAVERVVCVAAFALMALALIGDVLKREITGAGLLGATQVGLIGLAAVAMLGFGLAAQSGGQLRAKFLDWIFPRSWDRAIFRLADLISAVILAALAALCWMMVLESQRLGDVASVLRTPIWPVQMIIAVAFSINALRYLLFALYPDLRPPEDPAPETAVIESPPERIT